MMSLRLLMCRPDHFAVDYAINPWMDPAAWARDGLAPQLAARREWTRLHRALIGLGAAIDMVPAAAGLPDLVFTANAAVVLDGTALLARFRHPERRGEEAVIAAAFRALAARGHIARLATLPEEMVLEGAGDCVWDQVRRQFWLGYGPRSDLAARRVVEEIFGVESVALALADPRFYHMDTALCPLPRGEVIYVPGAFTAGGLGRLRERVAPDQRIELDAADAARLAANAVSIGDAVVLSRCSDTLSRQLAERGYRVISTPLDSFLRSGGSAFCLTLRLDHRSAAADPAEALPAARPAAR